jgi:hypothetical protein
LLLMIIQNAALLVAPKIGQTTVVWILIAATLLVLCLLILLGIFVWKKTERSQQFGGNFFVVIFGILAALIGFLVAFPLLISGVFEDPTQVLALLTALFGTIVGLVGTFFGIKTSSDARQGAQNSVNNAVSSITSDTTPPTVSSVSPLPKATGVSPGTSVTATFSKDMDTATITKDTFKLVERRTNTPVLGKVVYDPPTNAATFRPDADLKTDAVYQVRITADVKDKAGNAMAQEDTWEFTVGSAPSPSTTGGA